MSLLAFGEALVDFLSDGQEPESFTKFPGGAPANVAVAYTKLGGKSAFCGALGQDMFGDFLLASLQAEQVNTQYCVTTKEAKTGLAFVSLDKSGERSFSFYRPPAADLMFKSNDFQTEAFEAANIFHICSNSLTQESIYQTTLAGLEIAKRNECIRSFDINLRENLWPNVELASERIWQCIANADVLKFSTEELEFLVKQENELTGIESVVSKCLSLGVSLVVHTKAGEPVDFYTQEFSGNVDIPTINVVDTTAAGDAFVGGLLFMLSDHMKGMSHLHEVVLNHTILTQIISFATRCGAYACQSEGAFPSLPAFTDIENKHK